MIRHLQPSIKDCGTMDENRWGKVLITKNLTSLLESEHPDMFSNFPLNICYYSYDFCCYHPCHYFAWNPPQREQMAPTKLSCDASLRIRARACVPSAGEVWV